MESSCEVVESNGCLKVTEENVTANGVDTKDNVCPLNSELSHDQKDLHVKEEDSENENTTSNGETEQESKSEIDIGSVGEVKSSHDAVRSSDCPGEEVSGDDTTAVATEQTDGAPKTPEKPPGGESISEPSDTGELPRKRMKLVGHFEIEN
jgi:hypothetical protein